MLPDAVAVAEVEVVDVAVIRLTVLRGGGGGGSARRKEGGGGEGRVSGGWMGGASATVKALQHHETGREGGKEESRVALN